MNLLTLNNIICLKNKNTSNFDNELIKIENSLEKLLNNDLSNYCFNRNNPYEFHNKSIKIFENEFKNIKQKFTILIKNHFNKKKENVNLFDLVIKNQFNNDKVFEVYNKIVLINMYIYEINFINYIEYFVKELKNSLEKISIIAKNTVNLQEGVFKDKIRVCDLLNFDVSSIENKIEDSLLNEIKLIVTWITIKIMCKHSGKDLKIDIVSDLYDGDFKFSDDDESVKYYEKLKIFKEKFIESIMYIEAVETLREINNNANFYIEFFYFFENNSMIFDHFYIKDN
ncbi:hypothetical protein HERIO_2225 [Hepatospora eriocheir]|uniref:Uncharacterized protein n=1 Tax=Hepatospora eriocheir TaxID=1081669 RepID=A0A1X0Q7R3_9MICR|nr:hypothetical protein HERIO_2225 [Hepatospora eriocheir]